MEKDAEQRKTVSVIARHTYSTRFGGFLRKHGRFLSLVGAFIVFLTYVSKEQQGETLKSLTESLENAKSQFVIQTDVNHVFQSLSASQHEIVSSIASAKQATLTSEAMSDDHERDSDEIEVNRIETLKDTWRQDVALARAYDFSATQMLDLTLGYASSLPSGNEEIKKLSSELEEERDKKKGLEASADSLGKAINSCNLEQTATGKIMYRTKGDVLIANLKCSEEPSDIARQASSMTRTLREFLDSVNEKSRLVFEQAEAIAREKIESYESTRHRAFALYTLGWILGLLGRVYDISGLNSGE